MVTAKKKEKRSPARNGRPATHPTKQKKNTKKSPPTTRRAKAPRVTRKKQPTPPKNTHRKPITLKKTAPKKARPTPKPNPQNKTNHSPNAKTQLKPKKQFAQPRRFNHRWQQQTIGTTPKSPQNPKQPNGQIHKEINGKPNGKIPIQLNKKRLPWNSNLPETPTTEETGNNLERYLREIALTPLLTRTQENELAIKKCRGNKTAREYLIRANLRLVVKIAKNYEHCGLPLLDLISEGNIGLMTGIDRYDPNVGAKISTYVSWWIHQKIARALSNHSRNIRIPVHAISTVRAIHKSESEIEQETGRPATNQEISDQTQIPIQRVANLRQVQFTVSLDATYPDSETGIQDTIPDPNAVDPGEQAVETSQQQIIAECLAQLDPRSQDVIKHRFGLGSDNPETLETIGNRYGITRERIRQIEAKALRKLRFHFARAEKHGMAFMQNKPAEPPPKKTPDQPEKKAATPNPKPKTQTIPSRRPIASSQRETPKETPRQKKVINAQELKCGQKKNMQQYW